MPIESTAVGKTGLWVARLGVDLAEIGSLEEPSVIGEVLNAALDSLIQVPGTYQVPGT